MLFAKSKTTVCLGSEVSLVQKDKPREGQRFIIAILLNQILTI